MKLVVGEFSSKSVTQYVCKFTSYLDNLLGLNNTLFKHYLVINSECVEKGKLPLRVPGCTVGELTFDTQTKVVTGGKIYANAIIKYPENIDNLFKKINGEVLEFPQ